MNPRIKELKISNYKKKIASKYDFLKIISIYYGDEDFLNNEFSKIAVNSDISTVTEFSFYDVDIDNFKNKSEEYKKAIQYFKAKATELFEDDEIIIFNIKYNGEYFRIECVFDEMILNFSNIAFSEETIFLFDSNRTKHISILRMEYSFEVIVYDEK